MINKYKLKNILMGILVMAVVSLVSLLVVSVLTYFLKWQAPQAQMGITITYILSGVAGGLISAILKSRDEKRERNTSSQDTLSQKLIRGITLGTIYMVILLVFSIIASQNINWDMGQIFLIWILLSCSSILGIFLKKPLFI